MRQVLAVLMIVCLLALTPSAHAVNVEKVVSPGGISAWLVRDHHNPIINMRFAFRGGSALDPVGKGGLANLVSALLDEGAGNLDSTTFRQTLEDKAIRLRFDTGKDTFSGQLQTLTRNRDEAFRLFKLAITKPRFDVESVARIRAQILVEIKQEKEDLNAVAGRALFEGLFPSHPYGRPSDGTEETVKAISVDDMKAFVRQRLGRDNLIIGAVGDVTSDVLGKLLDETFGSLPAKAMPWKLARTEPLFTGKTTVIDKNIPQSTIVFADAGFKRGHPDFYAAFVMNHILGSGSFTSRLYAEVREKRGLAYSVHSGLYPFEASSLTLGGAGTANARVSETLKVIADQWRLMAEKGVGDKELVDAKRYLTGAFPLRFSSSGRIARMLVGMQVSNLGIDYLQKRNSYIEAVTRQDIHKVAKKLLDAKRMTTIVVGQPKGVESTY